MIMIKDILKSNDVLRESLNESQINEIEMAFNEAVDLRASQVANDIIAEKEISLKEEYEAKELELVEKFEEHTTNFEEKMVEKVGQFIEDKIQNFIDESQDLLESEIDSAKSQAILSVFDNLISAAGVSASELVEKAQGSVSNDYNRICEKYDIAVADLNELKIELSKLRKEAIINEVAQGMNLVDGAKFKNIASLLVENDDCEDDEDCEKVKDKVEQLKKSQSKSKDSDDDSKDPKDSDDDDIKESFAARARTKRAGHGKDWSAF